MIKFFRRIRQNLLAENRLGKYLFYAIGEIILVVVGILIALQINNWNERRKDRLKERKLLSELVENLEFNLENLDNIISDFKADDESSDLIIAVIAHKQLYNDSLDYHFARALNAKPLYPLTYVAYESMKNMGFEIVQNNQLRNELINLFELTYSTAQLRQSDLPETWEFVRERFLYSPIDWSYTPYDFNELLNDREFRSLLNNMKSARLYIRESYEASLRESQRILRLLDNEMSGLAN